MGQEKELGASGFHTTSPGLLSAFGGTAARAVAKGAVAKGAARSAASRSPSPSTFTAARRAVREARRARPAAAWADLGRFSPWADPNIRGEEAQGGTDQTHRTRSLDQCP